MVELIIVLFSTMLGSIVDCWSTLPKIMLSMILDSFRVELIALLLEALESITIDVVKAATVIFSRAVSLFPAASVARENKI